MTIFRLIFFITISISCSTFGQSLTFFFKKLPAECTPEINSRQRDSLLHDLEFTIPGGDSIETVKYGIDTSHAANYLHYEYSFTTGQNGFIAFELKKFTKSDGQSFIVFSRCGGLLRSYDQQDLKVFTIDNNVLIEDAKQTLLPKNISINSFLKKGTPEAAKKRISELVSCCFDLNPDKANRFEYTLSPQAPLDKDEKWVIGYSFLFTWTGLKFDKKLIDGK